ncbi:MBL fold metallo-hydrolase [Alteromonas facilis]|uniref:MBL fold metallo-hydrolase n=1 Tax=Alteromonas facilis TaxID=2048004 RepID=UPI000C287926|nr:MBL fold metallo-hydrolase [Alteromonas facilis]
MKTLDIMPFIEPSSHSVTYVVSDTATGQAAIIDPVYTRCAKQQIDTASADEVIRYLDSNNLDLQWLLETHTDRQHCSASTYIKALRGGEIGISEQIKRVPAEDVSWHIVNGHATQQFSDYDYLFEEGEVIYLGHLALSVILTPGLSPAASCYQIGEVIFVGDALALSGIECKDSSEPNGINKSCLQSMQKLLARPNQTRLLKGHESQAKSSSTWAWESTVFQEKHRHLLFG